MVVLWAAEDGGLHEVLPWGISVGISEYRTPIDGDGSKQGRAAGVVVDNSLGSAKDAGDELPVPPELQWRRATRLTLYRLRPVTHFCQSCPRHCFCLF